VQALQVPVRQYMFTPQLVPFATLPVEVHTVVPVAHDVVPVWQRFPPGEHDCAGVHALHPPLKQ
jgi:hypothetical protein